MATDVSTMDRARKALGYAAAFFLLPPVFSTAHNTTFLALMDDRLDLIVQGAPVFLAIPTLLGFVVWVLLIRLHGNPAKPIAPSTRLMMEDASNFLAFFAFGFLFAMSAGVQYAVSLQFTFPLEPYHDKIVTLGLVLAAICAAAFAILATARRRA